MNPYRPMADATINRVLVVTAHPDDAEFSAGATICGWVGAGVEVAYCVVTSGDSGGFDDTPRAEVPVVRRKEQRAAAASLGVRDVSFLEYPDGDVEPGRSLRRDLTRAIRRWRPERVLTHSPQRNWEFVAAAHPDHLAVGEATLRAVYPDARNAFAHHELLLDEEWEPWATSEVWMMGAPMSELNHYVDIEGSFDRKIAALREHASQTGHFADLPGHIRSRAEIFGARCGAPAGRPVEAFQVIGTG